MNAAALPLAWVLMWVDEESVMTLNTSRTETSQSGCQSSNA
ncbi:hypothetical protein EAM_2766 [Erwinia amylovora ATCC 49946]|nr:hypothetical protein EAM_2766 [Erwinia amylovora ATCC 49946]